MQDDNEASSRHPRPGTPLPNDAADDALRRRLAQYGEPGLIEPPPELSARLLASLPQQTPAAAAAATNHTRRRRLAGQMMALASLLLLGWLGGWGVFFNSDGPARLFGDTAGGLGHLVLILVLAAKPLVHALLAVGALPLLLGALTLVGLGLLWWYLVQQSLVLIPTGAR